jgi:penicillin amidase
VRLFKRIALGLVFVTLLALAAAYLLLSASLPALEGERKAAGLGAAVSIERDALGIPTITAATRADLAYGTGFAHAQDRFFQMDLSRRLAGGELSELFGAVALEHDRRARKFLFRAVARESLRQATDEQRTILEAYARGVNAGLDSLRSRPWEYWVLQVEPRRWVAEDTLMVTFAMWWDLQFGSLRTEIARREIASRLSPAAMAFLYPRGTSWDATNNAEPSSTAPLRIPSEAELNVRASAAGTEITTIPREPASGSNGWVLSGQLTASGAALVASDMHLGLRVPTVWYRARLRLDDLDLNGLTLPGAPVLVAGSNGHIAWGYTNSYGDWLDADVMPCTEEGGSLKSMKGLIQVKGGDDVPYVVKEGPSGVLFQEDVAKNACTFVRWLATVPAATNLGILSLERATSVEQALALAPSIGIPHQNFMVGDRDGHIGWSVIGRIPADAARGTLGEAVPLAKEDAVTWTDGDSQPHLLDPPSGRLWTANARPIDGAAAESLIGGDEAGTGAGYDLGARAGQIRDDLMAITGGAKPADMLRVQLDDRARFLARWRELALKVLEDAKHAELRKLISADMPLASSDSVGYRLVRGFRNRVEQAAWGMILESLNVDPKDAPVPAQFEGPLWELVTQQPIHLLAARYPDWNAFLLAQADALLQDLAATCPDLAKCTWGSRRPVAIRHPLASALPLGPRFLDMPTIELPGDHDMPRVQDGDFGASNRFAVSPGHESEGYLTIAGGQSGHPLSPYYRAGFEAWAEGRPLPFLPGPAAHRLQLAPE